jgi:hypothetical protein
MWQFITAHPTAFALGGYYVFGALVGGMPAPTAGSNVTYRWVFGSLNILASNITRASSTTLENSPNWSDAVKKFTSQLPKQ